MGLSVLGHQLGGIVKDPGGLSVVLPKPNSCKPDAWARSLQAAPPRDGEAKTLLACFLSSFSQSDAVSV